MNPIHQAVNPYTQEQHQETMKRQKEAGMRFKEQVIATFCTPHGLQLLDTMEEMFVKKPCSPPGCPEGYGYMREGQNSFIMQLRAIVKSAQEITG